MRNFNVDLAAELIAGGFAVIQGDELLATAAGIEIERSILTRPLPAFPWSLSRTEKHRAMLVATIIVGDTLPGRLVWTASGLSAALGGILPLVSRDLRGCRWEDQVAPDPHSAKTRTVQGRPASSTSQLGGFAADR